MLRENRMTWQEGVELSITDVQVRNFVESALIAGYRNIGVPDEKKLVQTMFHVLSANDSRTIEDKFNFLQKSVNGRWHGRSVKDRWSDYYKDVESINIAKALYRHIEGRSILEVGTGRGWISRQLDLISGQTLLITQTDILDYRVPDVIANPRFNFVKVTEDDSLPFQQDSFDTILLVYVLHHCLDGCWRKNFLKKLQQITKRKIVILDDTYLNNSSYPDLSYSQMDIHKEFIKLNERQKLAALIFSCTISNKIDGGGMGVPASSTFVEFNTMVNELATTLSGCDVSAEYIGIPNWKVYLNSEGLFVISKR